MIYVASSWRNARHGEVIEALRERGLEVYDFKEPSTCFNWKDVSDVVEHGGEMTPQDYYGALAHPLAQRGFAQDMRMLEVASSVIMVLPCGNSAHMEMGWAAARGKHCAILVDDPVRDMDLMHLMVKDFYSKLELLVSWALRSELAVEALRNGRGQSS